MCSLMVRSQWCPCTYSNGEVMGEGLARLDQWVNEMEIQLKELLHDHRCSTTHLDQELRHIRQAVFFLVRPWHTSAVPGQFTTSEVPSSSFKAGPPLRVLSLRS